jgi:hypothetical protein
MNLKANIYATLVVAGFAFVNASEDYYSSLFEAYVAKF